MHDRVPSVVGVKRRMPVTSKVESYLIHRLATAVVACLMSRGNPSVKGVRTEPRRAFLRLFGFRPSWGEWIAPLVLEDIVT
jgi:hypothetical protein